MGWCQTDIVDTCFDMGDLVIGPRVLKVPAAEEHSSSVSERRQGEAARKDDGVLAGGAFSTLAADADHCRVGLLFSLEAARDGAGLRYALHAVLLLSH